MPGPSPPSTEARTIGRKTWAVYDDKPDLYPVVHDVGCRLLRVAAAARDGHGPDVVGDIHEQMGQRLWARPTDDETQEALSRVGDGVGRPILSFSPPDGPAFFGPVISDTPGDDEALQYWDALSTLADMPGFAEVKRSLRSFPVTELTRPLAGQTTKAG